MTRTELQSASEALQRAVDAASGDESTERLEKQIAKLDKWADAEKGPDHGQLAKVERIGDDVAEEEGDEVREHVEAATEHVHAYRETIEGV